MMLVFIYSMACACVPNVKFLKNPSVDTECIVVLLVYILCVSPRNAIFFAGPDLVFSARSRLVGKHHFVV